MVPTRFVLVHVDLLDVPVFRNLERDQVSGTKSACDHSVTDSRVDVLDPASGALELSTSSAEPLSRERVYV